MKLVFDLKRGLRLYSASDRVCHFSIYYFICEAAFQLHSPTLLRMEGNNISASHSNIPFSFILVVNLETSFLMLFVPLYCLHHCVPMQRTAEWSVSRNFNQDWSICTTRNKFFLCVNSLVISMPSLTSLVSLSCGNTGSHFFVDHQMMVFERLCCCFLHPQLVLLTDRLVI